MGPDPGERAGGGVGAEDVGKKEHTKEKTTRRSRAPHNPPIYCLFFSSSLRRDWIEPGEVVNKKVNMISKKH